MNGIKPSWNNVIFVVSAPSGAGKSTLAQRLVASVPDLVFSISFTTRKPRPGEVDGRDYFFIDEARFDTMVREGGFVEWVQVYGHRYGTGRDWLQQTLATGRVNTFQPSAEELTSLFNQGSNA